MASPEAPYSELVDTTTRVMTWNVWGRFGPWEQRAAGIRRVIGDSAPDIVLLEESWVDADGRQQSAMLADELEMRHCCSGADLLFGDWGPANAVLSRWPIAEYRVTELPALDPAGWGGLALHVLIDGPRGQLPAYCVALDWPPASSPARQHALRHLAGEIVTDTTEVRAPVIVGGDFNASPGSDELRMLTGECKPAHPGFVLFDAWNVSGPDDGATWSRTNPWTVPTLLPDRRIDYVLTGCLRPGGVGSAVAAGLTGTQCVDGVVPSDHYAVWADVRY
ncbi:MAG: endonuclease/exonuclease/phosphatase family protein [Streptosporangiaceae bacterium]